MNKLEPLIIYIVANASKKLGRTELIKLLYLFEYYHTLTYGEQYSNALFERYRYGPYSGDVIVALKELDGIILEESYRGLYGKAYAYSVDDVSAKSNILPGKQKQIADFVLEVTRSMNFQELLDFVYSTQPMVRIMAEEVDGSPHHGEELNMTAKKPIPKFTRQELNDAKARNKNRKPRGSKEKYLKNLIGNHESLKNLRIRANKYFNE